MDLAKKELGVPIVLDPEYLASPHLDELSGMTYLSYFMKENGPGYRTTLNWVRNQMPERHISNFTVLDPDYIVSTVLFYFNNDELCIYRRIGIMESLFVS